MQNTDSKNTWSLVNIKARNIWKLVNTKSKIICKLVSTKSRNIRRLAKKKTLETIFWKLVNKESGTLRSWSKTRRTSGN